MHLSAIRSLAVFLSAAGSIGSSVVLMYLLLRSRLNGIGWVAVMEPNDPIFLFEVVILYPILIASGIFSLSTLKRTG